MFKGVNRKIVEINQTGNEYIERAILFVNPKKADKSQRELTYWAEEYLEQMSEEPCKQDTDNKYKKKYRWIKLTAIFIMGCIFGWFMFYLFS